MPDRVISVPQETQIATRIKNKFDNVNERLAQQAETIEDLTTRLSDVEELLNITRGEGGS